MIKDYILVCAPNSGCQNRIHWHSSIGDPQPSGWDLWAEVASCASTHSLDHVSLKRCLHTTNVMVCVVVRAHWQPQLLFFSPFTHTTTVIVEEWFCIYLLSFSLMQSVEWRQALLWVLVGRLSKNNYLPQNESKLQTINYRVGGCM